MRRSAVALFAGMALGVIACSGTPTVPATIAPPGTAAPGALAASPPKVPPPIITQAKLDAAVGKLDSIVETTMTKTGVPGMAVAVVYKDKVVYSKAFGVREVGRPDQIDPATIFQLASLSKPIASTVVAGVVGQKAIKWDDPVTKYDTTFALKDQWVTDHVSFADLFSHRSGLPLHTGDLLEDLGLWPRRSVATVAPRASGCVPRQLRLHELRSHRSRRGGGQGQEHGLGRSLG